MNQLKNYIIFDIETTGFSGTKDKCIEIGALKVVDGQVISTFECLLNHGIAEDVYIPDINGITLKEVEEKGINPQVAYDEFVKFIDGDFRIIGHNVLKFDIPFLIGNFPEFRLFNQETVLDTAALYKAYKMGVEIPELNSTKFMKELLGKVHYGVKYSMDTAIAEFGLDKSKITQHRALGDCYLTNELYKNLCITPKKKEGSSID